MTVDVRAVGRGVVIEYRGFASPPGVLEAIRKLADFDGFGPNTPAVWDFTRASGDGFGAEQMRSLGVHMSPLREGAEKPRVALLMRNDADYGAARMFIGLNAGRISSELRIFRDPTEAYMWALEAEPPEVDSGP
jgi:hypothetical protein